MTLNKQILSKIPLWAWVAVLFCVAAFLGYVFWVPAPEVEMALTDMQIREISQDIQATTERVQDMYSLSDKRVGVVREQTIKKMANASGDVIADTLNSELRLWRVAVSSYRLGDTIGRDIR